MQTYVLSHNYLNDKNLKYRNNDESTEENLTLRLRSTEQKTTFRAENMTTLSGGWTLKEGAELNYMGYTDHERRLLSVGDWSVYRTHLGLVAYGASFSAAYTAPEERWSASVGVAGRRQYLFIAHVPSVGTAISARFFPLCFLTPLVDGSFGRLVSPITALHGVGL